ncbi:uncharacterized protein N7496_004229 [Penicillium cataractarum]|uniref:Uncharacterized protein n=1 Tax=Penicillium cataractarum TaxID=2100454 RepID=A0A9W9SNR4_9EURO|nr:uncharacterized protein N7496_004229 [Penicillium cataractarum]KAJ5381801.1 hypothetical protein N7496_004229 [Penicillium cataractarum]
MDIKPETLISVDCMESDEKDHQSTSPKVPCMSHGLSKTPLLDRELQRSQTREVIHAISSALNELVDDKKCTKCTVENLSTLLTEHIRNLREAKQNGQWSKEDRKLLKAETKSLLKPVKKQLKSLWKAN